MRERALEIGATFHIVSLPDSGTRIEVKAPLNKEGEFKWRLKFYLLMIMKW